MELNHTDAVPGLVWALGDCPLCGTSGRAIEHKKTGQGFREWRRSAGVRLREASEHMGISIAYLSDLEHGRRNWSARLATRCAVAVSYLAKLHHAKSCGEV